MAWIRFPLTTEMGEKAQAPLANTRLQLTVIALFVQSSSIYPVQALGFWGEVPHQFK